MSRIDSAPSVQPNPPRFGAIRVSKGAVLPFEGPEKQGIVRVTLSVYWEVPREAACEREGDVGKRLSDLKVWISASSTLGDRIRRSHVQFCHAGLKSPLGFPG